MLQRQLDCNLLQPWQGVSLARPVAETTWPGFDAHHAALWKR